MLRRIGFGLTLAMLALGALGPAQASGAAEPVVFTTPAGSATSYRPAGTLTIRWVEPADPSVVDRVLVRQRGALSSSGGCAGATFPTSVTAIVSAGAVGAVDGTGHRTVTMTMSGHEPSKCYRYRVRLHHADGSEIHSALSSAIRTLRTWAGGYDIYRSSAFSTQKTYTWCIAASVQMMRNLIKGESDHGSTNQARYYDYARAHDRFEDWRFDGSDAQGWAATLRAYTGVSHYGVRVHATYRDSIRYAALQLRRTGKPVGLMVARGGHAWVMTGFRATADPGLTDRYEVTDIYIMGPLYPMQQSSSGYDRAPDTRYSYEYLKRFFVPFRSLPDENSELWDDKFVSVTAWTT